MDERKIPTDNDIRSYHSGSLDLDGKLDAQIENFRRAVDSANAVYRRHRQSKLKVFEAIRLITSKLEEIIKKGFEDYLYYQKDLYGGLPETFGNLEVLLDEFRPGDNFRDYAISVYGKGKSANFHGYYLKNVDH